jgi:hypothetical protein
MTIQTAGRTSHPSLLAQAPKLQPNPPPTSAQSTSRSPSTTNPLVDAFVDPRSPRLARPGENPPFGGVDGAKDAKYAKVDGTPFIKGANDAAEVDPNDVSQGGIGDCGVMASLSAVAKSDPETLKKGIRDNGDGSYTVTLYEKKPWYQPWGSDLNKREIRVTPDFPTTNGQMQFAKPGDSNGTKQELWPALYEKAYAQMKGDYSKIQGSNPSDVMEAITGKSSTWETPSKDSLKKIDEKLKAGDAVTVSSIEDDAAKGKAPFQNGTLVANHAYSVVGVDTNKGTVTLRNPWGEGYPPVTVSADVFASSFAEIESNPGS